MILLKLFLSFLKIGSCAIGGAYSFLPLIEREIVENYKWLDKSELLDIMGVVKILPGAISIKIATYTGNKIAGIPGVIAANLGNLVAPVILIMLVSTIYMKYKHIPAINRAFNAIQLAVFAIIIAVAFKLVDYSHLINIKGLLIAIGCFMLFSFTKIHPAFIIIGAGILGVFLKFGG